MARKSFVLMVMGIVIFFLFSISSADVPHMINYSGKVTKPNGGLINGTFQMTFSIYPDTVDSPADWTETQAEVVVKHSVFSVVLGSINPIPPSVFDGSVKYLGIQIESDAELRPLKPIVSVAYAYHAGSADCGWVDDGTVVRLQTDTDKVGIGTRSPDQKLTVEGIISVTGNGVLTQDPGFLQLGGQYGWSDAGRFCFGDGTGWKLHISKAMPLTDLVTFHDNGSVDILGDLTVNGFGFTLNGPDLRIREESRGPGGRALVHWEQNELCLNFAGDFSKTRVMGTLLQVDGDAWVNGTTHTGVLEIHGGADIAEPFAISWSRKLQRGATVIIDAENPGHLTISSQPYDRRVAGIVSGAGGINSGLTLSQQGVIDEGQNIALSGRVYVLATASNGAIKPGDLLTTSSIPGHAMKATDRKRSHGAIIGKAMECLEEGEGLVLVLVTLQ